jgi:hypothetical protein
VDEAQRAVQLLIAQRQQQPIAAITFHQLAQARPL